MSSTQSASRDWALEFPPEARPQQAAIDDMRARFRCAMQSSFDLHPTDVMGVLILARCLLYGDFARRGKPVTLEQGGRALVFAPIFWADHARAEMRQAGLWPTLLLPRPRSQQHAVRVFHDWVVDRFLPARRGEIGQLECERTLSINALWDGSVLAAVADGQVDPGQAARAAHAALGSAGYECESVIEAGEILLALKPSRTTTPVSFHGKRDGKLCAGWRSLRDVLPLLRRQRHAHRRLQRPMLSLDAPLRVRGTRTWVDRVPGSAWSQASGALAAVRAVDEAESRTALREICERRLEMRIPRKDARTLRSVRKHLFSLVTREVPQIEIATAEGVDAGNLSRVLKRERAAVLKRLGVVFRDKI